MADGTSGNVSGGEAGNTSAATSTSTTSTTASGGGGSWWGGWLKSAMDTSTSALEFIKRDLAEFTTTMERDTAKAAEVTKTVLQESLKNENSAATRDKVKQGFNKMFDGLSKALTTSMVETSEQKEAASSGNVFDRKQARLHAVQVDTGTYLSEPSGDPGEFRAWQAGFNLEEKKGDISELLVSKVEVRALYTRLVPSEVSHSDFWQRYFYKLHQLRQDELRKQALMKRAEKQPLEDDWEDDWSGDEDMVVVSEDPRLTAPAAEPNSKAGAVGESTPSSSSPASTADPSCSASASTSTPPCTSPVIDASQSSLDPSKLPDADKGNQPVATSSDGNRGKKDLGSKTVENVSSDDGKTSKSKGATTASSAVVSTPLPDSPRSIPEPTAETNSALQGKVPPMNAGNEEPKTPTTAEQGSKEQPAQAPVAAAAAAGERGAESLGKLTVLVPDMAASSGSAGEPGHLKTREKGDMVVVGSERGSPTSDTSDVKEPSLEDDWEQDFDVELTEEDLKAAEEIAKRLGDNVDIGEDWESWE